MRYFWLILLGASLLAPAHAAELPPFKAVYALQKGPLLIGETRRTLTRNDHGGYLFESFTRPRGLAKLFTSGKVIERSEWIYRDGRAVPLEYSYFNSGTKKNRDVQLSFNWKSHTVTNTINGEPWKMPLVDGTQDKLLYQLQIMLELAAGNTDIRFPVADGGKLKTYVLEWMGVETIRTPLGVFDAVRLRRVNGRRQTTIWCAAKLDFLPVRIEHRKDDEGPIVAVLQSVSGLGGPGRH
jgi:hypothetical protein